MFQHSDEHTASIFWVIEFVHVDA